MDLKRNKKDTRLIGSNMEGKLLPQALDLEESVLGALMLEREAMDDVADILKPDMFYKEAHQLIYEGIQKLYQVREPIDILTVTQKLISLGTLELAGGGYYITQLTSRLSNAANVEYHARIVQEKYISRELIRLSDEIIKRSYDDTNDVFDTVETLEKSLLELMNDQFKTREKTYGELFTKNRKAIEESMASGNPPGILCGQEPIDRIIAGFKPGSFIIVAGRPGMGKTSWMLTAAEHFSHELKLPGVLFSLEMSEDEVWARVASMQSDIPLQFLDHKNVPKHFWPDMMKSEADSVNYPLYVDDTTDLTIFELRSKARRLKKKYGIRYILVDYIQLMEGDSGVKEIREQQISKISRGMKSLAKELQIPVIVGAQLSRKTEEGATKRPHISHLRESGSLEQDADIIILLYRPEEYGPAKGQDGTLHPEGYSEAIIGKHRNGSKGDTVAHFDKQHSRFQSFTEAKEQELREANTTTTQKSSRNKPVKNVYEVSKDDDDDLPF